MKNLDIETTADYDKKISKLTQKAFSLKKDINHLKALKEKSDISKSLIARMQNEYETIMANIQSKTALNDEIELMQNHLQNLRKLAGWSTTELGAIMGINRQAVNALEAKINKLNRMHLLGLLYIFITASIINNNAALATVINLLFNYQDFMNYDSRSIEYEKKIDMIVSDKTKRSVVELKRLFGDAAINPNEERLFISILSLKLLKLASIKLDLVFLDDAHKE